MSLQLWWTLQRLISITYRLFRSFPRRPSKIYTERLRRAADFAADSAGDLYGSTDIRKSERGHCGLE